MTTESAAEVQAPPGPAFREIDLRRPDFRGGVPVRMADGQDWYLPQPELTVIIGDDDGYMIESNFGGQFDEATAAILAATRDDDLYRAFGKLARSMLAINYDLPPGAVGKLIRFKIRSFWKEQVVADIMAVANGSDIPKRGAATSESVSP